MVSVSKIKSLVFILAITVTNCLEDKDGLEIDINFRICSLPADQPCQVGANDSRCNYTKETITEEVSKKISVEVLTKIKDKANEIGSDLLEPATCVMGGPDGKKYNITSGKSYHDGRIKDLSDVSDKIVPPNSCGAYFDGFYPEDFGQWEFTMATPTKKIKSTTLIERVEGPCGLRHDLSGSSKTSELIGSVETKDSCRKYKNPELCQFRGCRWYWINWYGKWYGFCFPPITVNTGSLESSVSSKTAESMKSVETKDTCRKYTRPEQCYKRGCIWFWYELEGNWHGVCFARTGFLEIETSKSSESWEALGSSESLGITDSCRKHSEGPECTYAGCRWYPLPWGFGFCFPPVTINTGSLGSEQTRKMKDAVKVLQSLHVS